MVRVGHKPETERQAVAQATVRLEPTTLEAIARGSVPKGDVLAVARIAGLSALKRTPELIPLCHPVRVTGAEVKLTIDRATSCVLVRATVEAHDRTGVEMEALVAASTAALTVYDMCKSLERGITVDGLRLELKRGGKSGEWRRNSRR